MIETAACPHPTMTPLILKRGSLIVVPVIIGPLGLGTDFSARCHCYYRRLRGSVMVGISRPLRSSLHCLARPVLLLPCVAGSSTPPQSLLSSPQNERPPPHPHPPDRRARHASRRCHHLRLGDRWRSKQRSLAGASARVTEMRSRHRTLEPAYNACNWARRRLCA